jgi:hypothetical protein
MFDKIKDTEKMIGQLAVKKSVIIENADTKSRKFTVFVCPNNACKNNISDSLELILDLHVGIAETINDCGSFFKSDGEIVLSETFKKYNEKFESKDDIKVVTYVKIDMIKNNNLHFVGFSNVVRDRRWCYR